VVDVDTFSTIDDGKTKTNMTLVGVIGPKDHAAEYGFADKMREFMCEILLVSLGTTLRNLPTKCVNSMETPWASLGLKTLP
jgi:hypothetical protein